MNYPDDLPEDLRDRVEGAIAGAEILFAQLRLPSDSADTVQERIVDYIVTVLTAFTEAACEARQRGVWNGEQFRREYVKYLHALSQTTFQGKHPRSLDAMAQEAVRRDAQFRFEKTDEWIAIQSRLRDASISKPGLSPTKSTSIEVATSTPNESKDDLVARRKRLLQDYKSATGVQSNRKIFNARQHKLYRAQFPEWVSGQLGAKSKTAIGFEEFLKSKKMPQGRDKKY